MVEPTFTVQQIQDLLAEGIKACGERLLFTQCPYGEETEKYTWQTGWLIGFKELGRGVGSLKNAEEVAILEHYRRGEQILAEARE